MFSFTIMKIMAFLLKLYVYNWKKRNLAWDVGIKSFLFICHKPEFLALLEGILLKKKMDSNDFQMWMDFHAVTWSRNQSYIFFYDLFNVARSPCFNGHSLPDHSTGFSLFTSMESIILTSCNVVGGKWIHYWRRNVIYVLRKEMWD